MLGNLKNRFFSLQEEISSSVRQYAPAYSSSVQEAVKAKHINPYAGGEVLDLWQAKWEEIHLAHEQNAKKATKCDKEITKIHFKVEKHWKDVMTLQTLGNFAYRKF